MKSEATGPRLRSRFRKRDAIEVLSAGDEEWRAAAVLCVARDGTWLRARLGPKAARRTERFEAAHPMRKAGHACAFDGPTCTLVGRPGHPEARPHA